MLVAPWLTLSVMAWGCQAGVAPGVFADSQAQLDESNQAVAEASDAGRSVLLEFELPDEFGRPADAADFVTGFRVGYFPSGRSRALRTVDVPREALVVEGAKARVRLQVEDLPEGIDIRIRTLSSRRAGPWSQPVVLSAPPDAPRSTPRATAARAGGLTPSALEAYPEVSEMLHALVGEAAIEEELSRFLELDELVMALLIARDHGIPLSTIGRAVEGPPRQSVRNAVRRLRPDLPGSVTRRASAAAARMLAR